MKLPSAYAVASMLVLNVQRYADERGRPASRIRHSRDTFLKISERKTHREVFWSDLEDALDDYGWKLLRTSDGGVALVEEASIAKWTKISASRIAEERRKLRKGLMNEDDLEGLVSSSADDDEEQDETE